MLECPAEGKCQGCRKADFDAECIGGDGYSCWNFPDNAGKCNMWLHVAKRTPEALAVLARGPAECDENPAAFEAINHRLSRATIHDLAHEAMCCLEMLTAIDPQGNASSAVRKMRRDLHNHSRRRRLLPEPTNAKIAGRRGFFHAAGIPNPRPLHGDDFHGTHFIDAVEALHPYSKLSLSDIKFAHQHYGATKLPSVLCKIIPMSEVFDDWDEAVEWLRVHTSLWASNQAKRDAVGNFPTLPRPEYSFLQMTAGASPQGQYPKIYPIGGEMERAAVESLHETYHSGILPEATDAGKSQSQRPLFHSAGERDDNPARRPAESAAESPTRATKFPR